MFIWSFCNHKFHFPDFRKLITQTFHWCRVVISRKKLAELFLTEHLEKLDINQFNREGRTALQQSCLEGNLPLAKVLVKFGANSRIMTREGFSTLHLAVFSGHSHLMSYVMSLRWWFNVNKVKSEQVWISLDKSKQVPTSLNNVIGQWIWPMTSLI